jgi:hypothetical protein
MINQHDATQIITSLRHRIQRVVRRHASDVIYGSGELVQTLIQHNLYR